MSRKQIGLVQMPVSHDKNENISVARRGIIDCVEKGAEIIILPEIWNGAYDTKLFAKYAELPGEETYQFMAEMAKLHNIVLVGGSICEKDEAGRLYNTSYVFDHYGCEIARHRKWHLFDINVPGGQSFRESDVLTPGKGPTVFSVGDWTFGLGICFDIRFSEQAFMMSEAGAHALIYPAAFNPTTGPLHWELLFRARAMDLQGWTIGVAPARNTKASYISWANSMVVDPWGRVRLNLGTETQHAVISIDKETIEQVRQQIPLRKNRTDFA